MALASQSVLFCTDEDVEGLLSVLGVQARADDDMAAPGSDTARMAASKLQARNYATARVKFYCQPRYRTEDLGTSWLANDWATALAAAWLCSRRGEDPPKALAELAKAAIDDMAEVRAGRAHVPDIGTANPDWPAWSNVTLDARYRVRQARVQRPISEPTPASYPQSPDYRAEGTQEI